MLIRTIKLDRSNQMIMIDHVIVNLISVGLKYVQVVTGCDHVGALR